MGRKRKKKRSYTMSEKARAQRRGAARKHGLHATTPARQLLPSCNQRQCPLERTDGDNGYPCSMKEAADKNGTVIESCPLPLVVDPDLKRRFAEAIQNGEYEGVGEIAAMSLAAQAEILGNELGKLKSEGFAIEVPVFDTDGNHVGDIARKNPRTDPTLKLLEQLGHTAKQQAITPESQGEKKRNEGIGGMFDAMAEMASRFEKPAQVEGARD